MINSCVKILLSLLFFIFTTACSSGGDAIDKVFGTSTPLLTSLTSKIISQTDLLKIDVNNVRDGEPGTDAEMSYTCFYDRVTDGEVAPVVPCQNIPNSTATFNSSTGELNWTPEENNGNLGSYEIKISGKNSNGESVQIFNVSVRLKFNGITTIQNITGVSADFIWVANPNAVSYQIYTKDNITGLFVLHSTISNGSATGTTMTGLLPNALYNVRVQAIDALGFPDGNSITNSFYTTQLVKLSMTSSTTNSVAGVPVSFTVQAFNPDDSPQLIGGLAISSLITAGSSSGTFSAVTDQGNGFYNFTFTPTLVGTPITIEASTNTTTFFLINSIVLTVNPGPAQLAQSTISSTSNSLVSGNTITVTTQVRDQFNNPISSGQTITFQGTGGTSTGTFGVVNNLGNGVYTTTFTGVLAGTPKNIGVVVNGTPLGLTTPVTVTPGVASSATSTLAISTSTLSSGLDAQVTATLRDSNSNLISSGVLVAFNKSGGTSTGVFSSTVNNNDGTYTVNYTGVLAGSAQTLSVSVDGALLIPTVSVAVIPGAPSSLNSNLIISNSTVTSGQFVTATATVRDLNNNPIDSGITVSFSKTGGTSTGNFGTVTNQGSGQYNIRYTGIVSGTAQSIQLIVDGTNTASPVNVTVINAAPDFSTSTIVTNAATITSGNSATVTATLRDLNNNLIPSGYTVSFSKTGGTSTGNFGGVVNNGNGTYTITYTGLIAGSAQTISLLVDSIALGNTTSISVTAGLPSSVLSTLSVSSSTVVAGSNVTLTATLRDANSNLISGGHLVLFDNFGGTSTGNFSVITNQGNGVYTATYTGINAGTAQTVQINLNGAGFGPTQSIQVLVGVPTFANSTLTLSANTVASASAITATAVLRDSQNNPITNQYVITIDANGGSSTGTVSAVTNLGMGSFQATYSGLVAGTAQTIRVFYDGIQIPSLTDNVLVIPGSVSAANSTFTIANAVSATVQSTAIANLAMNLRDSNNNVISAGGTAVTFTKTAAVSDGIISAVSNLGSGNYSATYTGTTMGTAQTITLYVDGINSTKSVIATVTAGPPTQLLVTTTPVGPLNSIDCNGPYTMTLRDANNNTTVSISPVTVSLTSAPVSSYMGRIFNDSGCVTSSGSALNIPASTSQISFYYKSYIPEALTLNLNPNLGITGTTANISTIPVLSFIGSMGQFTMNGSGSQTVYDDTSGGSYQPQDTLVVGSHLYVADFQTHRIMKYNITTNTLIGWIGHVGSTENIAAYDASGSCNGLSVAAASLTPVWCTGGRSNLQASTLLVNPRNLSSDGTYLYVAVASRILRFVLTTGAYAGWYGRILSPTGMTDNGVSGTVCSSSAVGATTPLWCYGGTHQTGTGDGQFNVISGFTFSGNFLYVTDYNNHRIQRLDVSGATPVFSGWIGRILTTTGMGGACLAAGVGATTPMWCFAGTSGIADRYNLSVTPVEIVAPNEGFRLPLGLTNDGTNLYISDGTNYRIVRVDMATAAFTGWLGFARASTVSNPNTPTVVTSSYTSTWTTGGIVGSNSNGVNGFNLINNISIDTSVTPNILYLADQNAYRIVKIRADTGQSFQWIGRNSASPTGGNFGCSSSPVGAVNPGWCVGGASGRYGNNNAAFYTPTSATITATKIFVADSSNARVQRFDKTTGVFDGWIGSGSVPVQRWARTIPAGTIPPRAGWDDYSFLPNPNQWYMGITSNGTDFFQADASWNRIKKFNLLDGTIVGYVGVINRFGPSAPSDCAGYTSGFTPTWCTGGGGTSAGAGVHGYNNPFSITSDSTYVYVGSYSNHRIDRIRISDGAYSGWIGYVNVTPTDGDPGCNGAAVTAYTPGWCINGSSNASSTNTGFNAPRSVYHDLATGLIFTNDSSGRLIKLNKSTGAIEGVAASMSASTGCTRTGNTADGWCTTGTGVGSNNYGGINNSAGIGTNSNYIFVADMGYNRINRYVKSTGAPAGFLGVLSNATNLNTASATFTASALVTTNGCLGVVAGFPRATPGWCVGTALGSAVALTTGAGNGMFNSPRGLWADDSHLYVSDFYNNRVLKYNATTGAFIGWKGFIASSTGMTCLSGSPTDNSVTPDWCLGGTAAAAKALGGFDGPTGLWGDLNYIYVTDMRNNRIVTVPR